ncbi:MAG: DUF2206 domain-containing protein [Methanobacterium sp.]
MNNTINYTKFTTLMIFFLILVDLSIILDIPLLKQILSFLFLSFIPGLLIIHIFKLKINNVEKIIISTGLSIALILFMGLLVNQLFLFGYKNPLSILNLLAAYNFTFILLIVLSYLRNKDTQFNLSFKFSEITDPYYIIPLFFPVLAIMGTLIMNNWNINLVSLIVLLLIPAYVIYISLKNSKLSSNIYPYSLFLIGISLLLMWALRSNYIVFGADTDWEYYLYSMTLANGYWMNLTNVTYDSCLSISILPVIYQKFLSADPQFLFRILYPLLFSVSPLIVYSIARRYLGDFNAFLASFFFISFYQFFSTNNRVDIALIFFGLILFTMFSSKISNYYKKILIIIFLIACILSHYTTAFITLAILLSTSLITFLIDNIIILRIYIDKYGLKNVLKSLIGKSKLKKINKQTMYPYSKSRMVTFTLVILFFSIIFIWESYVMQVPFDNLVYFVYQGFFQLKDLLLFESGGIVLRVATGQSAYLGIPGRIEFILSWLIIFLTILGLMGSIIQKKISKLNFKNKFFRNMNLEFIIISFIGIILLIISFIIPFVSVGYNILRTYFQMLFILSVFIIIGTFFIGNFTKIIFKIKNKRKSNNILLGLILIIIIPYFLCTTGVMYQLFDIDRSIMLNSQGKEYDDIFIHEQEIMGAKWLKDYKYSNKSITTDYLGRFRVIIGGLIEPYPYSVNNHINEQNLNSYIYLRYFNVVNDRILVFNSESNITNVPINSFDFKIKREEKIYDNGGTTILY